MTTTTPNTAAETLAEYAALLERWDAAKKAEQAARVDGDVDAVYAAGWAVTDATAAILRFEEDEAVLHLMRARWARKHFPNGVANLEGESETLAQMADAVARLEQRIGVQHDPH